MVLLNAGGQGDSVSIILGIDPARALPVMALSAVGRQLTYLGSGCIRTKVDDLPSRLKLIYAGVTEIITQFQPDYFAIEQVFMAKMPTQPSSWDRRAASRLSPRSIRNCPCLNTRRVR